MVFSIPWGIRDDRVLKGYLTAMTPSICCNTSRALLASDPIERREGSCFPLGIAALSLCIHSPFFFCENLHDLLDIEAE